MYDTINLWLPNESLGCYDVVNLENKLSNFQAHQNKNKEIYYSGYIENYKINLSERGVSLKGSLAKYFLPDNYHTLTRDDTRQAIEMLSDELQMPIGKAQVGRIDVAHNIIMNYKPEIYYPYLGSSKYLNRLVEPNSLYFQNTQRTKLFYNKALDGNKKGFELPKIWLNQNVLRYEYRIKARLRKQLNMASIEASCLHSEEFYLMMIARWSDEYKNINKLNKININFSDMDSPKDFSKLLELYAIKQLGQDCIFEMIEELKAKETFSKPEYYSRIKKHIKDLSVNQKYTSDNVLIKELDSKVKMLSESTV